MDCVLVVAGTDQGKAFLSDLLKARAFDRVVAVSNGGEARRAMIEDSYDLVLINAPLRDESGFELAISVTQSTDSSVIVLVKSERADEAAEKVEDFGVLIVPKPVLRQIFYQTLKIATASRRRMLGLINENTRLQHKIEEIKLVDRAKCALIQYRHLTEQEAHYYLEKQAMDQRLTRRQVAEEIIKTYEG